MSLASDPAETIRVELPSDPGRPWTFRHLTARQFAETAHIGDAARAQLADLATADVVRELDDAIKVGLLEGQPDPADTLTLDELWALYWRSRNQSRMRALEKNASAPPSASAGDGSAQAASPAPAPTPSDPTAPPSSSAPPAPDADATPAKTET